MFTSACSDTQYAAAGPRALKRETALYHTAAAAKVNAIFESCKNSALFSFERQNAPIGFVQNALRRNKAEDVCFSVTYKVSGKTSIDKESAWIAACSGRRRSAMGGTLCAKYTRYYAI